MSIGDSKTSIANAALGYIGEDPITDIADRNKRAILCNEHYDRARRFILRAFPWGCARKQAQIPASTPAPLFTWQARFLLPTDYIRHFAEAEEYDMAIWEILADPDGAGPMIYSNDSSPLNLIYVWDLQDCTKMDSLMVDCVSLELAVRIVMPITQSATKKAAVEEQLKNKLSLARTADAQERGPREWDVDILLRARR